MAMVLLLEIDLLYIHGLPYERPDGDHEIRRHVLWFLNVRLMLDDRL